MPISNPVLNTSMSTAGVSPTTYLTFDTTGDTGNFTNISSSPLNINITSVSTGDATYENVLMFIVISASIRGTPLTTAAMSMLNFNYSFVLPVNAYFQLYIGNTSDTLADTTIIYAIDILQTPVASGGARIVDVIAAPKPKLRKSSIRMKKVKKHTAKYKK